MSDNPANDYSREPELRRSEVFQDLGESLGATSHPVPSLKVNADVSQGKLSIRCHQTFALDPRFFPIDLRGSGKNYRLTNEGEDVYVESGGIRRHLGRLDLPKQLAASLDKYFRKQGILSQ